jgi:hypothetical protein
MSGKAAAAILFGLLGILAAWVARDLLGADNLQRLQDSATLVTFTIGFFTTIYGSALIGQIATQGLRSGTSVGLRDVAISSAPVATGAALMIAAALQ